MVKIAKSKGGYTAGSGGGLGRLQKARRYDSGGAVEGGGRTAEGGGKAGSGSDWLSRIPNLKKPPRMPTTPEEWGNPRDFYQPLKRGGRVK